MTGWQWQPWLTTSLILTGLGYAILWQRRRVSGRVPVPSPRDLVAWVGGLLAIAIAACSPIDTLSDSRFSVHMVQHEIFAFVAAPLLVVGAVPLTTVVLPYLGSPVARWGHAITRPQVAWCVAAVVLWAWHWPPAYDAALARPAVHDFQHFTLLTAYVLYWSPFAPFGYAIPALRSGGARALYLVTGGGQSAVLGALLAFRQAPLYSHYIAVAGTVQSALQDQEVGGTIMLLSGAVVFAVAAAITIRED